MTTQRPLTASLHTVTAVTRVALLIERTRRAAGDLRLADQDEARCLTADALHALGYEAEACETVRLSADLSPLLAKCLASVTKALQS